MSKKTWANLTAILVMSKKNMVKLNGNICHVKKMFKQIFGQNSDTKCGNTMLKCGNTMLKCCNTMLKCCNTMPKCCNSILKCETIKKYV